jgi:hypothetical protein
MAEAELSSDLLVALCAGVQTNKSIEIFYRRFEDNEGPLPDKTTQFDRTMSYIGEIYPPAELVNTNWSRVHLFYSLFTSVAHGLFGLQNLDEAVRPDLRPNLVGRVRVRLDELSAMYDTYTARERETEIPPDYQQFIERSRRGTTDTGARVYRSNFICRNLRLD